MRQHLAIFSPDIIKAIFSGQKNIETRFSLKKIPPYGLVGVGDRVYIKPPGKEVVGQFKVSKVIYLEGMEKGEWEIIKGLTGKLERDFIKKHSEAKYATLIYMSNIEQFITSPVRISKKDLRGWVVLD